MTQNNKVISIHDRIATLDSAEIQAMKSLMLAVQEAEVHSPGVKANEIVNDLVDFMLVLTQKDCQTFARAVRQIMDSVVDARSTHRDVTSFSKTDTSEMTSHQKLVHQIQGDLNTIASRSIDVDIARAIEAAGFEPRRPIPGPSEFDLEIAQDLANLQQTEVTRTTEQRLETLEKALFTELQEIRAMLLTKV